MYRNNRKMSERTRQRLSHAKGAYAFARQSFKTPITDPHLFVILADALHAILCELGLAGPFISSGERP